jgi:hypothetical protein
MWDNDNPDGRQPARKVPGPTVKHTLRCVIALLVLARPLSMTGQTCSFGTDVSA